MRLFIKHKVSFCLIVGKYHFDIVEIFFSRTLNLML